MRHLYLLDSNILVYLSNEASTSHRITAEVIARLRLQQAELCICPQSIVEARAVLTRPLSSPNGIGFSSADATAEIADHLSTFTLIPDTPTVFSEWKKLAENLGVLGKQNHDARVYLFC